MRTYIVTTMTLALGLAVLMVSACSSPAQTSSSTGGAGGHASSSATGNEGAGKACGNWDPANADTPPPKCKLGTIDPKCDQWAGTTVPPGWPDFTTSCGPPSGGAVCFLGTFEDFGAPCEISPEGDAACGKAMQDFVKGDGEAIAKCREQCDINMNCFNVCTLGPCGPPNHACLVNQLCVKRPGQDEACETPCE